MPYADKDKDREYHAKYREARREEAKIYARKYNHTDKTRDRKYQYQYGITLADYNRMLEEQNHVCAICLQGETMQTNGKVKRLSVDHDHKTGAVRGLLCQRCNTTLGRYEDNPELMKNLISYLQKI
jgi:Recombination endonuclease VII